MTEIAWIVMGVWAATTIAQGLIKLTHDKLWLKNHELENQIADLKEKIEELKK